MSEERLQEIKDSINLQYKVQEANDLHSFNIFTDEEQELVEEVERLQQRIDKAIEYMDNLKVEDFSTRSQYGYILVDYNRLVSILMGKPRFTNEKGKE